MKRLNVVYVSKKGLAEYIQLADADIDPKHGDIVFNGYGISIKQAKEIRDWLTIAIRKIRSRTKM